MATIAITLDAIIDGKQQTVSRLATIDDAVMPHFFDAYRDSYGEINIGSEETPSMRPMTDEETFATYATGIANGSVTNVQGFVRAQAHAAAETQIPVIEVKAS